MRIKILTFATSLLMFVGMVSCSKENETQKLTNQPNTENIRKADGDLLDRLVGFLKKKVKLDIEFGHNEPDPNNPGILECVFEGLCKAEIEVSFGVAGVQGAGGYNSNGEFILAFKKSDMTEDEIEYHFGEGVFTMVDPIVIPSEGILDNPGDHTISTGVYSVIHEDSEIIAVNFN